MKKKAEFTMSQVVGFILMLIILGLLSWYLINTFVITKDKTEDCTFQGFTCVNGETYCETPGKGATCKGDSEGMFCCARIKSEEVYTKATAYLTDQPGSNAETVTYSNGASHVVTIDAIRATDADVTITSDPVPVKNLKYGEERAIQLEMPYVISLAPNIQKTTVGDEQIPLSVKVVLKQDITAKPVTGGSGTGDPNAPIIRVLDKSGDIPESLEVGQTYTAYPQDEVELSITIQNPTDYCRAYLAYKDEVTGKRTFITDKTFEGTSKDACKQISFTHTPQLGGPASFYLDVITMKEDDVCAPSSDTSWDENVCWASSAKITFSSALSACKPIDRPTERTAPCMCGDTPLHHQSTLACSDGTVIRCVPEDEIISADNGCNAYCTWLTETTSCTHVFESAICNVNICGYNLPDGCHIEGSETGGYTCDEGAPAVPIAQAPLPPPPTELVVDSGSDDYYYGDNARVGPQP